MENNFHVHFETVMVIDDNRIDLYIASRLLTKNNFCNKVLEYSSALDALNYLWDNEENISVLPDVIFVDIYMPGMSGFEFMEEYDKLSPALKDHCRVFIISSSRDEHDVATANRNKNILAMEEKPISKEFLNRVNVTLNTTMPDNSLINELNSPTV